MLRLALVLAAQAALVLPAVAAAGPPAPEPAGPALIGTPYLVRADAQRVTLYLRLDRPLRRRFDGELRATATIDGRFSSLAPVPGRRAARGACYSATVVPRRVEPGRLYAAVLLVDGAGPVTTLTALRSPRAGDARGAPLGC
jgi:hypothetical protein